MLANLWFVETKSPELWRIVAGLVRLSLGRDRGVAMTWRVVMICAGSIAVVLFVAFDCSRLEERSVHRVH